jgi:hypothetical protein
MVPFPRFGLDPSLAVKNGGGRCPRLGQMS